jgi:hypothetical protein
MDIEAALERNRQARKHAPADALPQLEAEAHLMRTGQLDPAHSSTPPLPS